MLKNNHSNESQILDDKELDTLMNTVLMLTEKIHNYLISKSTKNDNYFNHQDVLNYQDKLNMYSVSYPEV